jgi:hypothetical protein
MYNEINEEKHKLVHTINRFKREYFTKYNLLFELSHRCKFSSLRSQVRLPVQTSIYCVNQILFLFRLISSSLQCISLNNTLYVPHVLICKTRRLRELLVLKPHCIRCSHFKVDDISTLESSAASTHCWRQRHSITASATYAMTLVTAWIPRRRNMDLLVPVGTSRRLDWIQCGFNID